ncbi:sensor histidine kinase [Reyranella sp.]|uniref:sensor histidine kinase n=1 Tax=Reyranella sp. TaxID=1929291 RepID=UPI003BAC4BCC
MLARWSLRTRLLAAVVLALVPVFALSLWNALDTQWRGEANRAEDLAVATDLGAARQRETVASAHRLLEAVCANDTVRAGAAVTALPEQAERCGAYLGEVLRAFPNDYASLAVTDAGGVVRCSNVPGTIGMNVADRPFFKLVRERRTFVVGPQTASRVVPSTVIPAALPIRAAGGFAGMCAVGITLQSLSDLSAPGPAGKIAMALVDREGTAVGGSPEATRTLPVAARLAAAIVGGQTLFREYGQDGQPYDFRLRALPDTALFVVAGMPVAEQWSSFLADWASLLLAALALAAALAAVAVGADRWCTRPLNYIREFADRVARGEELKLDPMTAWGPEMVAVGEAVKAMAQAIASREAELRAGLEQRDHMLREIHHRVKNNLQMISSLLNLQAGEIRSPRIRRFFGDAQNRVLTLSILHRHLYERSSWALVDFQQFISDLVRQITVGRRAADRPQPRYQIRAPIMAVGPDVAIPIGLIVTEAVSSALNRSNGTTAPEIRIEAADRDGMVELTIEDNCAGAGGSIRPDSQGGFSLTLIRGLSMQLGGEAVITAREGGGVRVAVTFPMPQDPEADA